LSKTPITVTNAIAHAHRTSNDLREGGLPPTYGRILHDRPQALASLFVGRFEITEVDERGVKIEKFHDGFRLGAHPSGFGHPNHEWNPRSYVEYGHLVPPSVFAEVIAMISQ
jgi:hypothetical protein